MYLLFQTNDYTFKGYYFGDSFDAAEPESSMPLKTKKNFTKRRNNLDVFFERPKQKKKIAKQSSYVGQASGDGISYIASNDDDGLNADYFVKIEIYDMKKIRDIAPINYWKHADLRLKYYVSSEDDKYYQTTRDLLYNITKHLAEKDGCSKYYVENKEANNKQ